MHGLAGPKERSALMDSHYFDALTRSLAATRSRRGALAALAGSALAALGLSPHAVAAACRAPKRRCEKGRQCCTGRCKRGKCASCPSGARFVPAPSLLCWLAWGSTDRGSGQFNFPHGVAVGNTGQVYVADTFNHRVQQFTATGNFVRTWGTRGSGDPQFQFPLGVAVGSSGQVYVADTQNHRIQEFMATGGFVRTWGTPGSGNGQFSNPSGVAVGGNGQVYVADFGNHRVQAFDATGEFVRTWGSSGSGAGKFTNPIGVAAGNGHVYVADTKNHRVVRVQPL